MGHQRTIGSLNGKVVGVLLQPQRVLQAGNRVAHGVAGRVLDIHLRPSSKSVYFTLCLKW